jgi:polyphosphate:AMP phosphotransferase
MEHIIWDERQDNNMLETFNLSARISSESYDAVIDDLRIKLSELLRQVKNQQRAVLIIIEGRRGVGISSLANKLYQALDPRGVRVIAVGEPQDVERAHSFMWRFWNKLPASGTIAIFDRSWYSRAIAEKYHSKEMDSVLDEPLHAAVDFETQLAADGYLIIKFFLEISEKEQEKRLHEKNWDVFEPGSQDSAQRKEKHSLPGYHKGTVLFEKMLMFSDLAFSPWHIVVAEQIKYAEVEALKTIISSIELWLQKQRTFQEEHLVHKVEQNQPTRTLIESTVLGSVEPYVPMERTVYKHELKHWQKRLAELQVEFYKKRIQVFVVFEGWDAAGKGGCIVRLTSLLNPRAYVVEPVAAPNVVENSYHYLWRFYRLFPEKGHMTIFDRSWYGRVLVERVEGFCREDEWKRAYREINQMESLLHGNNAVIVKFWLHIDQDEQLRRFKARQEEEKKQWKITDEDWRNREKWEEYLSAVDDMIHRTSTPHALWTVVPANNKYYARVFTIKVLCEAIEKRLQECKKKG